MRKACVAEKVTTFGSSNTYLSNSKKEKYKNKADIDNCWRNHGITYTKVER